MQGAEPSGKPAPRRFSSRGAGGASPPIEPVPRGFSPGDARGGAPCIRKPKISPFPPGRALCERGAGGMGAKSTDMAENSQCRAGSAPGMQGAEPPPIEPAPRRFSHGNARGGAPCIRKPKISPFPTGGKGVGGMGTEKQTKGKVGRRQRRQAPTGLRNATSFVSRETSPLPCSVSRETSPPPFHVKHPLPCFT